jgi:DNA-binding CsgD family transcriptional regulator
VDGVIRGPRLNERLGHILNGLKQRDRPALLLFDTYESAGEAQDWVEKQLLPSLIRAIWLRVVIAGQRVPDRHGAIWEEDASPPISLKPPPAPDWFNYGKRHRPKLTLADVKIACRLACNRASLLQAQGKLEPSQEAFEEYLAISRRLAEQDPSNASWQRDLALALWRIAHLVDKAGEHATALPLYKEASRIFGVLAERAPDSVEWAKDKEDVESELSRCCPSALTSAIGLTAREAEVLYWITEGKSNPEISIILKASPDTVKKHAANVYAKLRVPTRTSAARFALSVLLNRPATEGSIEKMAGQPRGHPGPPGWAQLIKAFLQS